MNEYDVVEIENVICDYLLNQGSDGKCPMMFNCKDCMNIIANKILKHNELKIK